MHTKKYAFLAQRYQAKNRGIPFKFTFEQWCAWWEAELGPNWFSKRGPRKHEYVMARKRDRGPYAVWNVKCILAGENAREMGVNGTRSHGEKHWATTITEKTALAIRMAAGTLIDITTKFRVSKQTVRQIKDGSGWAHLARDVDAVPFTKLRKMHKRMTADDARKVFMSIEDVDKLAKEYGVSRCNILTIKRRASWYEATKDLPSPPRVGLIRVVSKTQQRLCP